MAAVTRVASTPRRATAGRSHAIIYEQVKIECYFLTVICIWEFSSSSSSAYHNSQYDWNSRLDGMMERIS